MKAGLYIAGEAGASGMGRATAARLESQQHGYTRMPLRGAQMDTDVLCAATLRRYHRGHHRGAHMLEGLLGAFAKGAVGAIGKKAVETATAGSVAKPPVAGAAHRIDPFEGREHDLEIVEEVIGRDAGAFIAICAVQGMGGIGKTRLAVEVANRNRDQFPDGVIQIDLRGTDAEPLSPPRIMQSVINFFDPTFAVVEDAAMPAVYARMLAGRCVLLILDNAKDVAQVEALLPPPPSACIITSRNAIALPDVPTHHLDALEPEAACALLRAWVDDSRASDAELDKVAKECACLPLALRVAGAFLKRYPGLSVAEYLKRLKAERPKHLNEVLASLALSYEQLVRDDPALAAAWTLIPAFAATFDAEAVSVVCGIEDGLMALEELAARALVLREDQAPPVYRLHDLMRDLAERRADQADRAMARRRNGARVAAKLGAFDDLYLSGYEGVIEALRGFDTLRPELERAFSEAADVMDDDTAHLCYAFANAGTYLLSLRLMPDALVELWGAAAAVASRLCDTECEKVALGNLGTAWGLLGNLSNASHCFERALALSEQMKNSKGQAISLHNLGNCCLGQCKYDEAYKYYEHSLNICQELGDRRGEAESLGNLAITCERLGALAKAIDFYEHGLSVARDIGYRYGEACQGFNRALLHWKMGSSEAACDDMHRALEIFEAMELPQADTARSLLQEWDG